MASNIYECLNIIGKGEFGQIIKARHKITNEFVAIKQNTNNANLLLYESKIIRLLQHHKNILKIKWYGKIDNIPSLVTELLSVNLNQISQRGSLNEELISLYGKQMISAVEHIHSKGYLHRDIKPDNFMIKHNNKREICIIDFGLARKYLDSNNMHIVCENNIDVIGSYSYCSKNMHRGLRPSRRDDIESLLYVMLKLLIQDLPWNNLNITNKNEKNDIFYEKKNNILQYNYNNKKTKIIINKILTMIKHYQCINYSTKPSYSDLFGIFTN